MRIAALLCLFFTNFVAAGSVYSLDEGDYSRLLRASYLYNKGFLDKSLSIFESLKKEIYDPFVYNTIADIYLRKAEFNKAVKILLDAAERFNSAESYYKLGIIYGKIYQNCKSAVPFYEKALKIVEEKKYLIALAGCYEDIKDFAGAINVYDKLLKYENNPEYYYKKGVLYSKLRLFDKSKDNYRQAVALNKHLRSLLNLSEIYIMEKEYDEAIRLLELAISEHGATYVAEERLAEIYRDKGELDKALNLFMSVVDRLQGNSRSVILKQIGLIYVEKKDFASAKDYFVSASKINSSDYQALYFAGFCNEIEGNYDKAANYYEQALDLRYDFSFARKRLAIVYINEKLFDKAKELLDDFDEKGMDVDYYIIKSMLYSKQDNFAKAVDILAGALEMFPSSMELMFELSTLYEKLKKYDECENILKQALALEPENPIFLNFLGYLYAELNIKLKEAYKMIERALKKDPENPAYMDSMAWVLYKMKKYNKAYEWQKKALKSGAKEDEYIQHMNAILEALGVKKSIDEVIKEN